MVGMEISEHGNRKKIRPPVSVPFDWEEKPGIPKKDWKPSTHTVNPVVPSPPVKLVTSVPFNWEEKPGKPLPCFSQSPPPPPAEVELLLPPEKLAASGSHPVYSEDNDDGIDSFGDDNGGEDEHYRNSESDLEASGFETNESFCPASSLLVGASFLECLFPLLSPKSSFHEKIDYPEKCTSYAPRKVESQDFNCERNCSVAVRRPPTLGELIMMSRRRSYRRKAIQMRRKNLSAESMKTTAVGCCIFGSNNRIEQLKQNWKQQLRLKLM